MNQSNGAGGPEENDLMALLGVPETGLVEKLVNTGRARGLHLSREQAMALAEAKDNVLRETGRIDLEQDILPKILAAFAGSRWLDEHDPVPGLKELAKIFYTFRGELGRDTSDDWLIAEMRRGFDRFHGEVGLVAGRHLPNLLREKRGLERDDKALPDEAVWEYYHGEN